MCRCNVSFFPAVNLNYYLENKMPKHYLYCIILISLSSIKTTVAQISISDTALYRSAQSNVIQLYIDSIKENLHLYNGTEFTAAYRSSAGHPFFEYSEPQTGNVFYDGIFYPGMRLSYDLVHDELIFVTPSKNLNVKLITQKINWFAIQNHLFVRVSENNNAVNSPPVGFYELAYEGIYSVLIKRKKYFNQATREDNISKFMQSVNYYVRKENAYYEIDSKRSLLAVCKDHKAEVSKYMQREGLNFKKDPANTTSKVIEYYSQLKN